MEGIMKLCCAQLCRPIAILLVEIKDGLLERRRQHMIFAENNFKRFSTNKEVEFILD